MLDGTAADSTPLTDGTRANIRAGRNQRGLCCPGTHTLICSTPGAGTSAARLPPRPSSATRAQAPRGSALPPRPDRQTLATSAHWATDSSTAHNVAEPRTLAAARAPRSRWWRQRLACARADAQHCAGYRPGPRASHQGRVRQRTCRLLRLCRLRSHTRIRAGCAAPPSRKHGMWVGAKEFTQKEASACEDLAHSGLFFCVLDWRCAGKLWSGRCEGAMPLRLNIRRKLTARSDRVKSVDVHPDEPWILCRYRPARSPARSSRACADPQEAAGGSLPAGAYRGLCGRARKPAHEERAAGASRLRACLRASACAAEP